MTSASVASIRRCLLGDPLVFHPPLLRTGQGTLHCCLLCEGTPVKRFRPEMLTRRKSGQLPLILLQQIRGPRSALTLSRVHRSASDAAS